MVDKYSECCSNRSIKLLEKNDIDIYSTRNVGISVVVERFIITLKNNISKYVTTISKNVYINKLDHIVNKYNNTYYRAINMKPADVEQYTYI